MSEHKEWGMHLLLALVKHGSKVEGLSQKEGDTPLHFAVENTLKTGQLSWIFTFCCIPKRFCINQKLILCYVTVTLFDTLSLIILFGRSLCQCIKYPRCTHKFMCQDVFERSISVRDMTKLHNPDSTFFALSIYNDGVR